MDPDKALTVFGIQCILLKNQITYGDHLEKYVNLEEYLLQLKAQAKSQHFSPSSHQSSASPQQGRKALSMYHTFLAHSSLMDGRIAYR